MRKIAALSFVLFALLVIPMGMRGQTGTEITYDFSQIEGFSDWGTGYSQHVVEYDDATVTFASANHQTSTISDIPVTKGQPVSLVLNETNNNISSVTFVCRQWGTKAQTITLNYSTNGGQTYTTTNITSDNFTISSTSLPQGTNAVKITFSSNSNQVGIESATITVAANSSSAVATAISIDDANLTNTDVYVGAEAGSLSATVTAGETIISDATVNWTSSDEAVATIDAMGVVTLVAAGATTITANYEGVTDQYQPSYATYELTVTSSAPYVQPTSIEVNLNNSLFGTAHEGSVSGITDDNPVVGTADNVTVTYAGSGNHYINNTQIRFYPNNKLTFDAPSGYEISEIVFTSAGTWTATISTNTGTYASETKTWTGSATSVLFTGSVSGRCDMSKATITLVSLGNAVATTTTIDATGISNTDLYTGTEAGSLSATVTVTEDGAAVPGAAVTWSSDNDAVATIDAATGAVTLVGAGSVTFTASYAGVEDEYLASSATYEMIVTNNDPNVPGTENNPYTVAEARAAIDAGSGTQGVYATGVVSAIPTAWSTQFNNITFNFVDNAGDAEFLQAYRCVSGTGVDASEVAVGDTVVVYGNLTKYNSTYEFAQGCQLVSLTHPTVAVEAPTFSPVAGTYAEAQTVAISCATEGASIYYSTDGTEPTNESALYSEALTIASTTTVKAIAYVGTEASLVATATYHFCSAQDPYTVTEALAFNEYPANGIYVHGIVSTAPTSLSNGTLTYYISDNGEAENQLEVYKGKDLENAAFTSVDGIQVGDIVTVYGNVQVYNGTIEFGSGNYLVAFERPVVPAINASNITINYDATSGEISYSIENAVEGQNLTATTTADWISDLTVGEESITFTCTANEGTEDRTATITLSYQGAVDVAITVTQGHFVADYATLPFAFDGGKADIATTSGLTQEGLGSDYNSSPKMKFDGTGDWLILHFNEAPGMLTFDIKGNSFSGGTFTVQTSADGENYADLATYTELGATQNEEFALGADVRYIKWVYTEKVNGNVGLGNIVLDKPCGKIVLNEANNYTWTEDFETMAAGITELWTGVEPHCWPLLEQYSSASMNHVGEETDTMPQVFYYPEFDAADGNYTLRMKYRSLLAMPELDETVEMSRLHLSMYVRQPKGYYKLLVGVWDEATNVFDSLFVVDNQSTNMEKFECDFSRYEGNGRYIAFKNVGGSSSNPHCSNYLDSIKLTYNTAQACSIDIEDYNEGFEGYTTNPGASGVEPYCWEVIKEERSLSISTKPQIYAGFNTTTTEGGNYTLRMRNRCVYAMPEFAEGVDISTLTMSFQLRQPKAVYMLQVGVVDAEGNFEMVSEINNATTEMEPVSVDFTGHPGSRIAFRNVLNGRHYDYSYNYIDDISFTVNTAKVSASEGSDVDVERYLDNIAVYPNPTTGMLYIDAVDVQKVECYNQMGQLVGVYDNANELNISELSNGVYMLRITVPQGVTMRKVVKR